MRTTSTRRHKARPLMAALLLAATAAAFGADTYSAGQLSIPSVVIGNAAYLNVVLKGMSAADLVSGPTGSAPVGVQDTYNPANNQLSIPALTIGSTTFPNLVLTAGMLVSIGSVSGADVFTATAPGAGVLSIPSVQLQGGAVYTDVRIPLSSANIVSIGSGLPAAIRDVFIPGVPNPQTPLIGQLLVPAVAVSAGGSSIVYTNVVLSVNLADITSLGGSSTPAVYVIDSTNTLFAFDANGRKLASASLPSGGVASLSGGGITTDINNVYVTVQTSFFIIRGACVQQSHAGAGDAGARHVQQPADAAGHRV